MNKLLLFANRCACNILQVVGGDKDVYDSFVYMDFINNGAYIGGSIDVAFGINMENTILLWSQGNKAPALIGSSFVTKYNIETAMDGIDERGE